MKQWIVTGLVITARTYLFSIWHHSIAWHQKKAAWELTNQDKKKTLVKAQKWPENPSFWPTWVTAASFPILALASFRSSFFLGKNYTLIFPFSVSIKNIPSRMTGYGMQVQEWIYGSWVALLQDLAQLTWQRRYYTEDGERPHGEMGGCRELELKLSLSAQLILEETDSTHFLKIHHFLVTTGWVIEHPCWGIHIHTSYTAVLSSNILCRTTVSFLNFFHKLLLHPSLFRDSPSSAIIQLPVYPWSS